ncbi:hypothetical protein C1M53_28930 [Mesorhizobium sp. Pch-S]|nr:hypothetical protein C1M53_28930 [Mesorhizobium sp. Pch-S]
MRPLYWSVCAFRGNAETLQFFVFTHFRTQNRCALLLELLWLQQLSPVSSGRRLANAAHLASTTMPTWKRLGTGTGFHTMPTTTISSPRRRSNSPLLIVRSKALRFSAISSLRR